MNFLHYTYSTKQLADKICLPQIMVSLQKRQNGKLFEHCETESASVSDQVPSENIYMPWSVHKYKYVNSDVTYLNKKL
jgi:hypothetical protein